MNRVLIDIDQTTAIIRINNPDTRNSLNLETIDELAGKISEITASEVVRSIILTGTDTVFASGADIRELHDLDQKAAHFFARRGQEVMQTLASAQQLTIAVITGYCLGGGLDLAVGCDLRIASKSAMFAHPSLKLGIITGWGGTQQLLRLIGKTHALEIFLTGRTVGAVEAQAKGLVDFVVDSPLEHALQIIELHNQRERR